MAYTIAYNDVGNFWEVFQDGRRIGRGFAPIDAIRAAVEFGGMPDDANIRSELLTAANNIINTNNATTKENNAGTGTPGTAGQGPGASPPPAPSPTTVDANAVPGGTQTSTSTESLPTEQKSVEPGSDPAVPAPKTTTTGPATTDPTTPSTSAAKKDAQTQANQQDAVNFQQKNDWRVRLSLTPKANYLYKAANPGILKPLQATDGVIFPYTPNIQVNYVANYEPTNLIHTNYKVYQYQNSSVDQITLSCDFTAQDTFEANYLLAVIHFFRSATKMFYGQDSQQSGVKAGTPPPICYLYGLGAFQFDYQPLVLTGFTYSLPNDVDYIRATNATTEPGVSKAAGNPPDKATPVSEQRLGSNGSNVAPGGGVQPPKFSSVPSGSVEPTYIPTRINIQLTALPIASRNDVSRRFSLKDYATGELLQGSKKKQGGMW